MPETVKEAIEITKKGFDGLGNAMNLYNKVLDQIVPWETYRAAIQEIERYQDDYSKESAVVAGQIQTTLLDADERYYRATQEIYGWCGVAVHLLGSYLQLFTDMTSETYEGQRELLMEVLVEALIKMKNGEDLILECLAHFKIVSGLLTSFDVEFKEKLEHVKKFFSELKTTIDKTYDGISDMITKLQDEVKNIKEFKIQTEATKTLIPLEDLEALRDTITKPVNNLISLCNEYQKRHGQTNYKF